MFSSISRTVDVDLPMQLHRPSFSSQDEPLLKIPSKKKLDSSSFFNDQVGLDTNNYDRGQRVAIIPEPPKLSRYSQIYKSHDW